MLRSVLLSTRALPLPPPPELGDDVLIRVVAVLIWSSQMIEHMISPSGRLRAWLTSCSASAIAVVTPLLLLLAASQVLVPLCQAVDEAMTALAHAMVSAVIAVVCGIVIAKLVTRWRAGRRR